MERRIDVLGEQDRADGQADRADQRQEQQFAALGSVRCPTRDRPVEQPKLFAFLALLEALGEPGFFLALEQRLVERPGALVVARQLSELLLTSRDLLDFGLIAGDALLEASFLALEDLHVAFGLTQGFLEPEHIGRERSGWGRRRLPIAVRLILGPTSLRVGGDLPLERGDLLLQLNDIRVLIPGATLRHLLAHASGLAPERRMRSFAPGARRVYSNVGVELAAELRQLLLHLGQAHRGWELGRGPARRQRGCAERAGCAQEGFGFGELTRQRLAPFEGARLVVSVHAELSVEPFEAREILLHLLRQLAQVAPLELAHAAFEVIESSLRLGDLDLEELCGAGR